MDEKKKYEYKTPSFATSDDTNAAWNNFNGLAKPDSLDPTYEAALKAAMDKINSREKFSYDLNGDALYQQYKDKFVQQGKMAMQDTMGQAAALTGGYGNSNAIAAGNQAYQASLSNLNDIVPELQQMAYDRYNQEGQDLLNQYSMAKGMYDTKYGEWSDQMSQYNADRQYLYGLYDSLYNRDYNAHRDAISDEQWQAAMDYQSGRDAVADEQWQAAFDAQYGTVGGVAQDVPVYKGSTKTGKNYDNGGLTAAQVKELQNKLGVEADGYYGSISSKAAGGLGAKEAYEKYVGKTGGGNVGEIPASITAKAASFNSNEALNNYLTKQYNAGNITEEQMAKLYLENEIPSFQARDWSLGKDGGINWFGGVDGNASVKDEYGNEYTMDQLVAALVSEGMAKSDAKDYVKKLQKRLGA